MAVNADNHLKGDVAAQVEKSGSYIFQQCLKVVTNFPEFSNLTYRVRRTNKDQEVMTISRDRLLGVFGPPLDPITLTIDPSGRCLVSILFKPVRRVSLVSGNTGGLDILSLLDVLRMIAGQSFFFCPGIPEKFLLGRACGRYVESHRAPFKRFQSPQCPVYYQMKDKPEEASSPNQTLFKMCPQCRQVATIVLRLPPVAQSPRPQNLVDLQKLSAEPAKPEEQFHNVPGQMKYVISTSDDRKASEHMSILPPPLLSLPADIGSSIPSAESKRSDVSATAEASGSPSITVAGLKRSSSEPKGQRFSEDGLTPLFSARSPATAEALRNVLLQKKLKMDLPKSKDTEKSACKEVKNRKSNKNVCRICKKVFSSPANLLNHIQRHEGFSGSLSKRLTSKLSSGKQNSSSVLMKMVLRGAKSHSGTKKNSAVSGTSLRLFMKCLNDLMGDQKNSATIIGKKGHGHEKRTRKGLMRERQKVEQTNVSMDSQTCESAERPSLSRSSSGMSAMQTLLEAAAIAGINSENFSTSDDPDAETASYNISSRSKPAPTVVEGPETKSRKSPRIASRLKRKELEASASSTAMSNTPVVARPKATRPEKLTEPGHLTNLDLLSSVSLNYMQKPNSVFPTSPQHSVPTPSQPVSISNILLQMPPQSTAVDSKYGGPPPLLLAHPGKDGKLPNWVLQSNAKQALSKILPRPVAVFSESMGAESEATGMEGSFPNCGAMDLTKPKQLNQVVLPGLISILDPPDKVSGGLQPSKFPKLLTSVGSDNIPVGVLINSGNVSQQQIPNQNLIPRIPGMVSLNKVSDVSLQNRMYASARDYKMDKKPSISGPQIHAMVASCGGATKPGSDEIQCGYKWSGSGGQVKERTQMVRELVPPDVMANYLKQFMQAPNSLPKGPVQPQVSPRPVLPVPKGPRPVPQHAIRAARTFLPQHLKSLPNVLTTVNTPEEVSCQVALNLTTAKQKPMEASPKAKNAPRQKRQSKKGGQVGQAQVPVIMAESEVSALPGVSNSLEPSGQAYHSQRPGVAPSSNFSSPSLAAILQDMKAPSSTVAAILKQPTSTSSNKVKSSTKGSSILAHNLNNGKETNPNSLSSPANEHPVKLEQPSTPSPDDDECIILSLPVKHESSRRQMKEGHREREGSASPGNLEIDLHSDSTPKGSELGQCEVKQEPLH